MKIKRIPAADRRSLILAAAKTIFVERGYDGAKTQQIAAAAKVSEALIFRHFPSKLALYRAVLRQVIRDQDANFEALGLPEPSTQSLISTITFFFRNCIQRPDTAQAENTRIMLASLAADGGYARLIYRRAMRLTLQPMQRAMDAAEAAGDMTGPPMPAANAALFVDHVGIMISASRATFPYVGDDEALLRDAVWFCCRGFGLTETALRKYYSTGIGGTGTAVQLAMVGGVRRRPRAARPNN